MLGCVRSPTRHIGVVLLALAAAACSSGKSNSQSPATTTTPAAAYRLDDTLRLDQVQVLGSHNSYHGRPYPQVLAALKKNNLTVEQSLDYAHAPLPQQFDLGIRQIELDVWDDPQGGNFAQPGYPISLGVKIPDDPVMHQPGFKVLHQANIDTNSTCLTFVRCLQLVKTWSDAHPNHVAMDIHVEMEDNPVTEPIFQRLEHEVTSVFPRSDYFTPDDVRGSAPTLGEAVRAHGWPTLGKVRGKVYFTLDNEGLRDTYLKGHPSLRGRIFFTPSSPGQDDAAFAKLNDPIADAAKIKAALAAHMIVRTRADADTFPARKNDTRPREAALTGGAQLVSTDYEQPDPTIGNGYIVRIPGGTPARCNPVTAPPGCTPADVEDPAHLTH
jgi:hypothetical protein